LIRRSLKIARWVKRVAVGIVLLAAVSVMVLAIRLAQGPIEIDRLRPVVERALSPRDGSYAASIEKTVIAWEGWDTGIRVQALGVRLSRADGSSMAELPSLSARFALGGLVRGELALTSLTLRSPRLHMIRRADGRVELGLVQGRSAERGVMGGILSSLARERRDDGPFGQLEAVRIVDGDLDIDDANLGRTLKARRFNANLARDGEGIRAQIDFDLLVEERHVRVAASGLHKRSEAAIRLEVAFSGLAPTMFAAARGPMRALHWFDTPFGGVVTLAMRESGEIVGAEFALEGSKGGLSIPGYFAHMPIEGFALKGRLSGAGRVLEIGEFRVRLDGPTVIAAGRVDGDEEVFDFTGTVKVTSFPVARLADLWPKALKASARAWVVSNITAGSVEAFDLRLDFKKTRDKDEPIELTRLRGAFAYKNLTIRYLRQMPPVTNVAGSAFFDARNLIFDLERGELDGLAMTAGRLEIRGFHLPREDFEIVAPIRGQLSDILRVLDRPPLRFAQAIGVNPVAVTAEARGALTVRFPLRDDIRLEDVDISATADLEKLNWRKGLFGLDVTNGRFRLTVDKSGMSMAGESLLGPEMAAIKWTESFAPKPETRRTIEVKTRFSPETLAQIGLDIRQHMSGPFGAELKISGYDDGRTTIDGQYDFAATRFVTPVLAIEKPAGLPATGRSLIVLQGQRVVAVPRFALDSRAITASGTATFHPDGVTIRTMDIARLVAGRTNLAATIQGERDGAKRIRLEGAALDLAPALAAPAAAGNEPMPPIRLYAKIGRLFFGPARAVDGVVGELAYDGRSLRRAVFEATAGAPISIALVEQAGGRALSVTTRDAGAVMKALGFGESLVGGALELKAESRDGAAASGFAGSAALRRFRVVRVPALARFFALASLEGLGNLAATDQGIDFAELVVLFRLTGGVLDLSEARAVGSQIGITANGRVDFNNEHIDLAGTLVPLYAINSIIGNLGPVGAAIIGERGSGVIAMRYSYKGPLDRAEFTVNPLSALTPGFLRGIFGPLVDRPLAPLAPRSAERPVGPGLNVPNVVPRPPAADPAAPGGRQYDGGR
jgi:hypothetical protein